MNHTQSEKPAYLAGFLLQAHSACDRGSYPLERRSGSGAGDPPSARTRLHQKTPAVCQGGSHLDPCGSGTHGTPAFPLLQCHDGAPCACPMPLYCSHLPLQFSATGIQQLGRPWTRECLVQNGSFACYSRRCRCLGRWSPCELELRKRHCRDACA